MGNHPVPALAARSANLALVDAIDLVAPVMVHRWPVTKLVCHLAAIVGFGCSEESVDLSYPRKIESWNYSAASLVHLQAKGSHCLYISLSACLLHESLVK